MLYKLKLFSSINENTLLIFIRFGFIHVTHANTAILKSYSREKSTQDENVRFIKGEELKLTQDELLSFFLFKCMHHKNARKFSKGISFK